jgi:uncharacterized DUF497 family protein
MLRAVIVPSNGAVILEKESSSAMRWTSARPATTSASAALKAARAVIAAALLSSISCLLMAFVVIERFRLSVISARLIADSAVAALATSWSSVARGAAERLRHFGRIDFGQELAGRDMIADVDVPLFQITRRARIDFGLLHRLDITGERGDERRRRLPRQGRVHAWQGGADALGFLLERRGLESARDLAQRVQPDEHRGEHQTDDQELALRHNRRGRAFPDFVVVVIMRGGVNVGRHGRMFSSVRRQVVRRNGHRVHDTFAE